MTNKPTHGLPPGSAAPADTQEMKEGPGGEAGAFKETSQSRDQGALDALILSQSTNQARRGSRKRCVTLFPTSCYAGCPSLYSRRGQPAQASLCRQMAHSQ